MAAMPGIAITGVEVPIARDDDSDVEAKGSKKDDVSMTLIGVDLRIRMPRSVSYSREVGAGNYTPFGVRVEW